MFNKGEERVIFSWLHLSDIHFMHGEQRQQVDQEMLMQALLREVKETTSQHHHSEVPKPDAIFVTGDIAYSGGVRNADEYIRAECWLAKIAAAVDLGSQNIFIVPGNHDIQRDVTLNDDDIELLIEALRTNRKDLEWALSKERQRIRIASRLHNFLNFALKFGPCQSENTANKNQLYWQQTLPVTTGVEVRLLGLNTTLLSQEEDKGKLRLSLSQIKDFPDLTGEANHLALALSHHPLSWLGDERTIVNFPRNNGHTERLGKIENLNMEV